MDRTLSKYGKKHGQNVIIKGPQVKLVCTAEGDRPITVKWTKVSLLDSTDFLLCFYAHKVLGSICSSLKTEFDVNKYQKDIKTVAKVIKISSIWRQNELIFCKNIPRVPRVNLTSLYHISGPF